MEKGDRVVMSPKLKEALIENDCKDHVDEFGDCFGIVGDLVFPNGEGNEINVRWEPSKLRYAYSPNDLIIIS